MGLLQALEYPKRKKGTPLVILPYGYFTELTGAGITSLITNAIFGTWIGYNVPTSITDSKPIEINKVQVPGGITKKINFASFGEREHSFSFRVVNKNQTLGAEKERAILDSLRYPAVDFRNLNTSTAIGFVGDTVKRLFKPNSFTPNSKVIFWWGVSGLPLPYYVGDLQYTLSQFNANAKAQCLDVSIQLILDEDSGLFIAERVYQALLILQARLTKLQRGKKSNKCHNPYYTNGSTGSKVFDKLLKKKDNLAGLI